MILIENRMKASGLRYFLPFSWVWLFKTKTGWRSSLAYTWWHKSCGVWIWMPFHFFVLTLIQAFCIWYYGVSVSGAECHHKLGKSLWCLSFAGHLWEGRVIAFKAVWFHITLVSEIQEEKRIELSMLALQGGITDTASYQLMPDQSGAVSLIMFIFCFSSSVVKKDIMIPCLGVHCRQRHVKIKSVLVQVFVCSQIYLP